MKCAEFETSISDYLENELDSGLRLVFEEHLLSCRECGLLLEEVRGLRELLLASEQPVPPGLVQQILDRTAVEKPWSLWLDLVRPTFAPFLNQRFGFSAALMVLYCILIVNFAVPRLSAMSFKDTPALLEEEAQGLTSQLDKTWSEIHATGQRWLARLELLKEYVYGRTTSAP
ncbi:MAG: zf-HC2 domain-containing protein [Acidobacteria bacterium]|nr:zf-HC2 domain-containing protein [Acidobacteriota bacterium]